MICQTLISFWDERVTYSWGQDDYEDLMVMLRDERRRKVCFYEEREDKSCPLIFAIKVSRLLRQGCIRYSVVPLTLKKRKTKEKIFV